LNSDSILQFESALELKSLV